MPHLVALAVVGAVALIAVGIVIGLFLEDTDDETPFVSKPDLRTAIAILVTVIWAISITAEIFIPAYTVSVLVHGIMGAVVGYLFSDKGVTFNIGGQ
jgi:uncharacterized membrane protein